MRAGNSPILVSPSRNTSTSPPHRIEVRRRTVSNQYLHNTGRPYMTHMTKTVSTSKKPRKQHSPEFRSEALKLAERIGVAAAARELSLYESQLYNWRSKQQQQLSSSERENELAAENARLKRQLAERAEELGILQKAATYFSKRRKCLK